MSGSIDTLPLLTSNVSECKNVLTQLHSRPPSTDETNKPYQTIMERQRQQSQQQFPLPLLSVQSIQIDENLLTTSNSIIEFLTHEQKCLAQDNGSELDIDSIFEEINRLSDDSDERSMDEILREAEILLSRQEQFDLERSNGDDIADFSEHDAEVTGDSLEKWKIDEHLKPIFEESTPRDTKSPQNDNDSEDDIMVSTRHFLRSFNFLFFYCIFVFLVNK